MSLPRFNKGDRVKVVNDGGAYSGALGTVHDCDAPDVTIACTDTPREPMCAVTLDGWPTCPPIPVSMLEPA